MALTTPAQKPRGLSRKIFLSAPWLGAKGFRGIANGYNYSRQFPLSTSLQGVFDGEGGSARGRPGLCACAQKPCLSQLIVRIALYNRKAWRPFFGVSACVKHGRCRNKPSTPI